MPRRISFSFFTILQLWGISRLSAGEISFEAPASVPRFDVAEFVLSVRNPPRGNPFAEAEFRCEFLLEGEKPIRVEGFCDAPDGSVFRLRFSPERAGVTYRYAGVFRWKDAEKTIEGQLRSEPSDRPGPVIVDPEHPKHFIRAGTRAPFYHLGYTAYHLLDPSNDLATIDRTIDYCAAHGFNKIRFLLSGYPRDTDGRTSEDPEHGVQDPWKSPNYGAKPGQVNPLPAWEGAPHRYDFFRFHVEHWRRADYAVRRMRERGILATCIFFIEKQGLPDELGANSEAERRLYRYGAARLAAFDNVWWDLANEHNEVRDTQWGERTGTMLKEIDPYRRLASAHGYDEFLYPRSAWADFIITQQYGDERSVHDWVLRYAEIPKPYVNEEYGYEGESEKPGHGQNADWVRRSHWAIAMAGGYATYGDWSGGVAWFYMGEPGEGKAALELRHLRELFERLPFRELVPSDGLATEGFCLARPPDIYVLWLPKGGTGTLRLDEKSGAKLSARWFDPRTGAFGEAFPTEPGERKFEAPDSRDWALLVRSDRS